MAESFKPENNLYIDSSCITKNRITLDSILESKAVSEYLGNNPDIDQLRYVSGVYGIYNCSKAPLLSIGVLEVLCYTQDWVLQRYTEIANGSMYERTFAWGTTWTGWKQRW